MPISTYSTAEMLGVISHLPQPSSFWLNLAFRDQINFETEEIHFDKIQGGRTIAPFVAPTVKGKVMKERGYTTTSFTPAYVKPKHNVNQKRLLKRRAGEPFTGQMSPAARRDAIVADILQEQKDMIMRRWEVMAAEAIIDGQVTVTGEDYPTQVVSFGRAAGNNVTLLTTDQWDDVASKPYKKMDELSTQMSRSCGYAITDWILGANAWEALSEHAATDKLLNTELANGNASLQMGPGGIPDDGAIVQLKGTVGVGIRIWTYSDIYEDDDGNPVEILDPDLAIGINPMGVQGIRCFGAIMDAGADYSAYEIYPKNWVEQDPSIEWVMSQSAPLMVPRRPNATVRVRVV